MDNFKETLKASRLGKFIDFEAVNGCWLWIGAKEGGYGFVSWRGKPKRAHRLLYELAKGEIEKGKILLHVCNRKACCNPAHLLPGTHQQNACHRWGWSIGEVGKSPPYVKAGYTRSLSDAEVIEIRRLYAEGVYQKQLAVDFKVDPSTISVLVNRKRRNKI